MPKILNIETATDICSVCVSDGATVLSLREAEERYDHAARITLLIQACMRESDLTLSQLDAVAVSGGPGSYTGLRIGTAVAKGICYALEKPLIAVDTLQSLALASYRAMLKTALYCPMIDARRMEVYTAVYDHALQQLAAPRALVVEPTSFDSYRQEGHDIVLAGNGAEKCRAVLPADGFYYAEVRCSARHLVGPAVAAYEAGQFVDTAYFSPFYLKPPNITRARKKL